MYECESQFSAKYISKNIFIYFFHIIFSYNNIFHISVIKKLKGTVTNHPCWFVCSWSGSWRCVRRRAVSCRSTPTRCCSRSQTTAPTSWSRWSTRWRSRANATDLHTSRVSARLVALEADRDEKLQAASSTSFFSPSRPATNPLKFL